MLTFANLRVNRRRYNYQYEGSVIHIEVVLQNQLLYINPCMFDADCIRFILQIQAYYKTFYSMRIFQNISLQYTQFTIFILISVRIVHIPVYCCPSTHPFKAFTVFCVKLFYFLLMLSYQPSCHIRVCVGMFAFCVLKFITAKVLLQHCKRMIILGPECPLFSHSQQRLFGYEILRQINLFSDRTKF